MENSQQSIKDKQEDNKKAWYKKWWGIILLIFVWPYFLLWYMWAKTNWNKAVKIAITAVAVLGVAYIPMSESSRNKLGEKSVISETDAVSQDNLKSLVDKNLTFNVVASNPEAYEGKIIQWGAKVFTQPEKDDKGVYLQAYESGDDNNFAIAYANPNFQVKEGDFIIVTGKVAGKFEGENAFGAKLEIPTVRAGYIEIATRNDVVAPTEIEVNINQSNTQHDFTATLNKVQLAKNETRFFVKLKNEGKDSISFYTYSSKITQGTKQYEARSSYDTGLELPSEILPGVEAEGIIVFPAIERNPKQLTIYLDDPSSSDYSINWKDIKFDIVLP